MKRREEEKEEREENGRRKTRGVREGEAEEY
jgi:hypothetical protein